MTTRQRRMAQRITEGRHYGSPSFMPVDVVVQSSGSRNEYGEFVAGATTTTEMHAVTTPLGGEERDVLPESARLSDVRLFWLTESVEPLRALTEGDRIIWEGTTYTALRAERWPGHWRVMGVRGEQTQ